MPGIDHAVNITLGKIPNHPCYSIGKYGRVDNFANMAKSNERAAIEPIWEILQLTRCTSDSPFNVGPESNCELGTNLFVPALVSISNPAIDRTTYHGGRCGIQNVMGVAASRAELRRYTSPQREPKACTLLLAETKEISLKQCIKPNIGVHR
jgi:hypothetical protein